MTSIPPLLRNRNFLWFWTGEGISQLGAQFTNLALPVLAVSLLGASELEVGVLGAAQTFSGAPGMTGTLTIRYRKPTPLHTDLRFEGRFDLFVYKLGEGKAYQITRGEGTDG